MSFAAPLVLLALAALPLLLGVYVAGERRSARARDAFALPAVAASVTTQRAGWRRHVPVAAYGVALAALVIALARPERTVAVPIEQASVILVTDRSGSMLATDVRPTRLVAAKKAAEEFLDAVPKDVRIGAIAFNHTAQALLTPTRDRSALRDAIRAVTAAGSTATGEALDLALRMARPDTGAAATARKTPAAIVLLSDGKSVRGGDPLEVAQRAKQAKVPIYTIALGTPGGTITSTRPDGTTKTTPVPPDISTLAEIARISGGEAHPVEDAQRLGAVYQRLGSQVATEKQKRQVTFAFAGGALVLLAGAAVASLRWFGRFV